MHTTHIQQNYMRTRKEGVKRAAGAGYLQNPPQSIHVVLLALDNGTQDVPPHNLSGRANKTADSCFRMHTGKLYLQVIFARCNGAHLWSALERQGQVELRGSRMKPFT